MKTQEEKSNSFALKSGAKGIVLASSIMEIIFGSILVVFAIGAAIFGICWLTMGQQWQTEALEFCGIAAVITVLLILACCGVFLSCSIFGIIEIIIGIKGVKATKNTYTLMNFRSKIYGYAIAYIVILVLYVGFFFSHMPLSFYLIVLAMYLFLLSITILKFIGCHKIPTVLNLKDTQILDNKKI